MILHHCCLHYMNNRSPDFNSLLLSAVVFLQEIGMLSFVLTIHVDAVIIDSNYLLHCERTFPLQHQLVAVCRKLILLI